MDDIYIGCFSERGKRVPEEMAFEYAKDHLDEMNERDKKEFVEWFFSGNWIKEKGEVNE